MYHAYFHLDNGPIHIHQAQSYGARIAPEFKKNDDVKAVIRSGDYVELFSYDQDAIIKSAKGWRGK